MTNNERVIEDIKSLKRIFEKHAGNPIYLPEAEYFDLTEIDNSQLLGKTLFYLQEIKDRLDRDEETEEEYAKKYGQKKRPILRFEEEN